MSFGVNRQQFVGPFAHCHNFTYKQNGSSSPYYCNNRGTFKWQIYYDDSQANHHTHCEWSAVTATDLVGKLLSFANIYIEREKERESRVLYRRIGRKRLLLLIGLNAMSTMSGLCVSLCWTAILYYYSLNHRKCTMPNHVYYGGSFQNAITFFVPPDLCVLLAY